MQRSAAAVRANAALSGCSESECGARQLHGTPPSAAWAARRPPFSLLRDGAAASVTTDISDYPLRFAAARVLCPDGTLACEPLHSCIRTHRHAPPFTPRRVVSRPPLAPHRVTSARHRLPSPLRRGIVARPLSAPHRVTPPFLVSRPLRVASSPPSKLRRVVSCPAAAAAARRRLSATPGRLRRRLVT